MICLQNRMGLNWRIALTFTLLGGATIAPVTMRADDANALLSAEALKEARCHVVGIYSPERTKDDDRVPVRVAAAGHPMIVVLCSYFGTQWHLSIDEKADVRQIIISGWFPSTLVLSPQESRKYPVHYVIGSHQHSKADPNYFWAYSWHSAEGRKVRDQVKRLTGQEVTTFQANYQGQAFVIDGKQGVVGKEMFLNVDAAATTQGIPPSDGQRPNRSLVESDVRTRFELETQEKEDRIKRAEVDLQRIKEKLAKRLEMKEEIIQTRIAALMKAEPPLEKKLESESKVGDSQKLAGEGWRLWQKGEFEQAVPRFEEAIQVDPKNGAAWNGLGWTQLQLRRFQPSVEAFDRAIALEPQNGGAMNGRGRALMALGKLDEAEKVLLEATLEAIKEYGEKKAIESQIASWFGLVEVNIQQKDFTTARDWATRYLKVRPNEELMKDLLEQIDHGESSPKF